MCLCTDSSSEEASSEEEEKNEPGDKGGDASKEHEGGHIDGKFQDLNFFFHRNLPKNMTVDRSLAFLVVMNFASQKNHCLVKVFFQYILSDKKRVLIFV